LLTLWNKDKSIINRPLPEVMPEVADPDFWVKMRTVYETGETYYDFEVPFHTKQENLPQKRNFNFVYAPVKEADGNISGIIIVAIEVTELVLSRQRLIRSENRFRDFILEAPMPTVLYIGPEIRIEMANEAMLKLWNRNTSVIGLPF